MADVTFTQSKIDGALLTAVSATAGPDRVKTDDRGLVIVHNQNAGAVVVTVVDPGKTKYSLDNPDIPSISITAAAHATLGPFPADLVGSDGWVHLTASPNTSVTFYGVRA